MKNIILLCIIALLCGCAGSEIEGEKSGEITIVNPARVPAKITQRIFNGTLVIDDPRIVPANTTPNKIIGYKLSVKSINDEPVFLTVSYDGFRFTRSQIFDFTKNKIYTWNLITNVKNP
jgi:hypothetical protein